MLLVNGQALAKQPGQSKQAPALLPQLVASTALRKASQLFTSTNSVEAASERRKSVCVLQGEFAEVDLTQVMTRRNCPLHASDHGPWRSLQTANQTRNVPRGSVQEQVIVAGTDATDCCIFAVVVPQQWVSGMISKCSMPLHTTLFTTDKRHGVCSTLLDRP
jgi:hypothetical protein